MFNLNLRPNERLQKIVRQTEMVLAPIVFEVLVLIYFPFYLLWRYELFTEFDRWFLAWSLAVFLYGVYHYLLWLANCNVITDQRVISIRYQTLFKKQVLECPLQRIVNVSYKTSGVLSSLMDFGDVEIQILGVSQPLLLRRLSHPAKQKEFLWQLHSAGQ
ncbi:MAG: hypothetical protein KGJ93_04820 [Patescibacteria group bacterium]|nr:hypothetical protein [Patescibacteria group bacterium]